MRISCMYVTAVSTGNVLTAGFARGTDVVDTNQIAQKRVRLLKDTLSFLDEGACIRFGCTDSKIATTMVMSACLYLKPLRS